MAKEKKYKPKRSTADKVVNAVIAIVMAAVVALASVALYNRFKPDIYTVGEAAGEKGLTVEEFVAEYGLEGAEADDNMEDYYSSMTLENSLKLDGITYEDFLASTGLTSDSVTLDMTVEEVQSVLTEMYAQMEEEAAEAQSDEE